MQTRTVSALPIDEIVAAVPQVVDVAGSLPTLALQLSAEDRDRLQEAQPRGRCFYVQDEAINRGVDDAARSRWR